MPLTLNEIVKENLVFNYYNCSFESNFPIFVEQKMTFTPKTRDNYILNNCMSIAAFYTNQYEIGMKARLRAVKIKGL
jgi:hypothetical protein